MSRNTRTDFSGAYRVVIKHGWGTIYVGPYQTLSAAKGKRTSETRYWKGSEIWIEKTPDGPWERVDVAD